MKSLPTQERAIKKRIALLKAALAEFESAGFEMATAKSIAARAGVATGTFYQYFENKNDILRVIAESRFSELHEQVALLESHGREAKTANGERYSKELDDRKAKASTLHIADLFNQVLSFLYQYHLQEIHLHRVLEQRRWLDPKLEEIMERGEELMFSVVLHFISDFDADNPIVVARSLYAMGEGLVHQAVLKKSSAEAKKILDFGSKILASGFTAQIKMNSSALRKSQF